VQVFWGLDKKLAQRKHFPSVNWSISYSNYDRVLEEFFNKYDGEFIKIKTRMREILQEEEDLTEIVQLVGKDSLSEDQKAVLEIAKIIREDFLQQNAFSPYDYFSPLPKTVGMMKCIVRFFENSKRAILDAQKTDKKISWAIIANAIEKPLIELTKMKFKDPKTPEKEMEKYFQDLYDDIDNGFRKLVLG
jgi:V-type H+-transporting ATPase subunit A